VLEAWACGLKLPFIGVLREAQVYVRSVESGLTVFDLPATQAEADLSQWKPIAAWLEPVLKIVRQPQLRTNASVQRPPAAGESPLVRTVAPAVQACAVEPAADIATTSPLVATRPRRGAVVLLTALLGWLTAPLFLHRNS